ncbi:MAG TPA: carbohydrate kinase [Bacteroidales bacterium]|nr:carbohydrate kinase [Bacteroidales bacterium]HOK74865.1 carbohydrate kinase [Bacteroidales bacterium]HOM40677.1 carbohydrate kinase [Bacteroidales bacterium]HOU30241.1 carbohydrate kinase [Bacteroidales bacterium]HPP92778.1 carbohydrate kinase [Bacteroidales bacterium]
MRRIFAVGEALVDIIFSGGEPRAAKAGGAMLNTSVSLGRAGLPVSFISEFGADDPGRLIDSFLRSNGVDTSYVYRFTRGNTALALAFLDENNNAHYTFYKNYPSQRLNTELPVIGKDDIFLFGSIYAITEEVRSSVMKLLRSASENNALVIYDPNFRSSHLHELGKLKPLIMENINISTVVRGSHEDFQNILGLENADEVWKTLKEFSKCIIYTNSTEGVYVRTPSFSGEFPVKKIEPVSTIGAGDNFNAGLIFAFYNGNIKPSDILELDYREWEKIIATAVDFATEVCLSWDNYIGFEFASRYRSASGLQI